MISSTFHLCFQLFLSSFNPMKKVDRGIYSVVEFRECASPKFCLEVQRKDFVNNE